MKQSDTRQQLLYTVEKLMYKRSIERISVNEIASVSNLTRQSFYKHFQDKYDAVHAIFLADVRAGLSRFAKGEVTCGGCMQHILSVMRNKQGFYINAMKNRGQNTLSDFMAQFFIEFYSLMLCRTWKVEALDENTTVQMKFWCYGMAFLMINWVLEGMKIPEKEMGVLIESLVLKNLDITPEQLTKSEWSDILNRHAILRDK